jgi:hypothetical protein
MLLYMSNITTQKYIITTKKIINVMKKINNIDEIIQNKYDRNANDIALYNALLEDSNNNFYVIIKNLK